jgi:hypothetical protein
MQRIAHPLSQAAVPGRFEPGPARKLANRGPREDLRHTDRRGSSRPYAARERRARDSTKIEESSQPSSVAALSHHCMKAP